MNDVKKMKVFAVLGVIALVVAFVVENMWWLIPVGIFIILEYYYWFKTWKTFDKKVEEVKE